MTRHSEAEINTIKNASVTRKHEIPKAYVGKSSQENARSSIVNIRSEKYLSNSGENSGKPQ